MRQTVFKIDLGSHSHLPPARALRSMPRHWRLDTPPDYVEIARRVAWLCVRAVAIVVSVVLVMSLVYGGAA